MKKSNQYYITLIFILIIQVMVMIFFGFKKKDLNMDEYFSYYSTSDNDFYIGLQDRQWNESDIMVKKCIVDPEKRFQYKNVYEMEAKDVHPPLYYYCLHTICSLFPGTFSKWTGIGLNILFFIISSILLGRITWLVTDRNWAMILAVNLFYGLNPAVVTSVMFIRMYLLCAVFILSFVWIHLEIVKANYRITVKNILGIAAIAGGGFLTHYHFIIFSGLFSGLFAIAIVCKNKEIKGGVLSFGAFIIGIALAVWHYPSCIDHIFRGYQGTGSQNAFFEWSNTIYRLKYFLHLVSKVAFNDRLKEIMLLLAVMTLLAIGLIVYRKRQIKIFQKEVFIIIVLSVAGYWAVVFKSAIVSGDESVRFTLPVYGLFFLMLLCFFFMISDVIIENKKRKNIFLAILMICGIILNISGLKGGNVAFLYPEQEERLEFALAHSNNPAILIHGSGGWMWEINRELEVYGEFYSVSQENFEKIEDDRLSETNTLVVYLDHTKKENVEEGIRMIFQSNQNVKGYEQLFETGFYDIYLFQ